MTVLIVAEKLLRNVCELDEKNESGSEKEKKAKTEIFSKKVQTQLVNLITGLKIYSTENSKNQNLLADFKEKITMNLENNPLKFHDNYLTQLPDEQKQFLDLALPELGFNLIQKSERSEKAEQLVQSFATDISQTTLQDPFHVFGFTASPTICPENLIFLALDFGNNKFHYGALELTNDFSLKFLTDNKNSSSETQEKQEQEPQKLLITLLDIYWLPSNDANSKKVLLLVFSVCSSNGILKIFLVPVDFSPAEILAKKVRLCVT